MPGSEQAQRIIKKGGVPPFLILKSVGPGLWISKLTGVGRGILEVLNKIIYV